MFRTEIDVPLPKSLILDFVRDPFIVGGVFGHVAVLQVKDKVKGDFVTPEYLQQPLNEFRVAYIYGVPPDYKVFPGIFKGPEILVDEIRYTGSTDDGKMSFKLSFILKSAGSSTRLYMSSEFEFKESFLQKLLGRSSFDLAKHIIEGHFIPYIKFYLNSHVPKEVKVGKRVLLEEEGDMNYIIAKFKEIVKNTNTGIIEINNEDLDCSFMVINGDIKKAICRGGKEVKRDNEALSALLFASGKGKLTVYDINLEDYISVEQIQD
ncbi:hypothetical protein V6M85_02565 [Sulfolobus tengchongensis]|uniref:Uncharacterized protein n=1 Tax=Sulfolobus tengchongensis TaxID=207809 RepID=A0AAX4L2Z7_9CREN